MYANGTFCSLSTVLTATRFIQQEPCVVSVPLEGRDRLEQNQEIKLAARSRSYGAQTRV